jgi:hypothetical protein
MWLEILVLFPRETLAIPPRVDVELKLKVNYYGEPLELPV